MQRSAKDNWTGKLGIIFAVAGSAVGLGNFLRFPGLAAQHGGGAFMVAYFISLLLIGIPVAWAEWSLGRKGGSMGSNCGPGIFWKLTKGSRLWKLIGIFSVIGPVSVAFYYILIEAWCLGYFINMLKGAGQYATAESCRAIFSGLVGDADHGAILSGGKLLLFSLVASLVINLVIIYRGITKGIEAFCKWVVPGLILISIILLIKVLMLGTPDPSMPERNLNAGMGYMWNPNKTLVEQKVVDHDGSITWKAQDMVPGNKPEYQQIYEQKVAASNGELRLRRLTLLEGLMNAELWIAAAGQVFLSLSVGVGLILTYGSYLKKKDDVALSALTAIGVNETCEVSIAGMMTVPAAVAFFGVAGAAGQGTFALGFLTLPQVFAQMSAGTFFGSLFFLLLFLAAITSSISLMQAGLAFFEEFMGVGRKMAVVVLGCFACIGSSIIAWYSKDLVALDTFDFFMGTLCFYTSAMFIMILFSWKLNPDLAIDDINATSVIAIPGIYRFIMKWVTPALLIGLLAVWLGENIWIKRAPAIQAVIDGDKGAVVALISIVVFYFFLVFITIASSRHHVWRPVRREIFPKFPIDRAGGVK